MSRSLSYPMSRVFLKETKMSDSVSVSSSVPVPPEDDKLLPPLTEDQKHALARCGIAAPSGFWVELVQQFGQQVALSLLSWLMTKSNKAAGLLDNVNIVALLHILGNLLEQNRAYLEDAADQKVREAIDTIIAYLRK